jgi:hypothetical protein
MTMNQEQLDAILAAGGAVPDAEFHFYVIDAIGSALVEDYDHLPRGRKTIQSGCRAWFYVKDDSSLRVVEYSGLGTDATSRVWSPLEDYASNGWLPLARRSKAKVPRWIEFGLALGQDAAMIEFVRAVDSANPILERMISGGLLQAAEGNPRTFLAAWSAARGGGIVSLELATYVAGLAAQFDLPAEFVAALMPAAEEDAES